MKTLSLAWTTLALCLAVSCADEKASGPPPLLGADLDADADGDADADADADADSDSDADGLLGPDNPSPANGATDVSPGTPLSWSVSSMDGAAVVCDVWLDDGDERVELDGVTEATVTPGCVGGADYEWGVECTNGSVTRSSDTWTFSTACDEPAPCSGSPTVTDADGHSYDTIQICGQCWMAENLATGFRVDVDVDGQLDNGTVEHFCSGDSDSGCATHGGLYQWDEVMGHGDSGSRGVCPSGWHVPSDSEWQILEMALGMPASEAGEYTTGTFRRGEDDAVGAQLAIGGSSGFDARMGSGMASDLGMGGYGGLWGSDSPAYFWTSTSSGSSNAVYRSIDLRAPTGASTPSYDVIRKNAAKVDALSVRCIKD